MPTSKKITHVIYDLDGLLLDTEIIYTKMFRQFARLQGQELDMSIRPKMYGRKPDESARLLFESLGLPNSPETFDEYIKWRQPILDKMLVEAGAMPGAEQLTHHLHERGVPQAIATSSTRHIFEIKTARHKEWFTIFRCLVTSDDLGQRPSKPAPDIFLLAAECLDADPAHCLVFEDAESGMLAARAAGMPVVMVLDKAADRKVFVGADLILDSLKEFQPEDWGLPSYS